MSGLQGKSVKKGLCIPPGENFHCGDLAAFGNVRWEVVRVCRLVHLHVEDCSEELLRQQSFAIKNQLGHQKPPTGASKIVGVILRSKAPSRGL